MCTTPRFAPGRGLACWPDRGLLVVRHAADPFLTLFHCTEDAALQWSSDPAPLRVHNFLPPLPPTGMVEALAVEDILHTAMWGECMDAQGNVAFTLDPAAVEENRLLLVPSPALNSVFVLDVRTRRNHGPLICLGAFERPKFVAAQGGIIVVLTKEDVVVVAGAAIVCILPRMTTSKAGRPRRPFLPTTACFAADPCRQEVYVAYAELAEGEAHHAVFVVSPQEWPARPCTPLGPIVQPIFAAMQAQAQQWLVAADGCAEPTVCSHDVANWQAECDAVHAVMFPRGGTEWPQDRRVVDLHPWRNGAVVVRRTTIARDHCGNPVFCDDEVSFS